MKRLWNWVRGKPREPAASDNVSEPPLSEAPLPASSGPARATAELSPAKKDAQQILLELQSARGTATEKQRLDEAIGYRSTHGSLPEELAVEAARICVERGEAARAIALLDDCETLPALQLAAELHAEQGHLGQALALIERVLARDFRAPGAAERHRRWSAALGHEVAAVAAAEPTLLESASQALPWRIVGEAGRGGAGVVYEAVDDALQRPMALKVYHRPMEQRDKLVREAQMAVQLAGPGIIRVYDVDGERGWVAMEWVGGGSLKQRLLRHPKELLPLAGWFEPLLLALARVHACGIVHGDIKPANVLFRHDGTPVVTDFGLAHATGARAAGGSRGYLSPERLAGAALTPADDVYAVGRLLEDVFEVCDPHMESGYGGWRSLARKCLVPEARRPASAGAVLTLLRPAG